jgi:hypothetical protein
MGKKVLFLEISVQITRRVKYTQKLVKKKKDNRMREIE